ncbi:hypothetical protein VD0002_g9147 [Verticillium dahliae]|uniref:Uncharacterized protein n=2 Tax=Verticillium dahliae TaxID=27337 RepID=G2XGC2_VERDV|nr:uncharacterized protein VDAG_08909 [Verticillium dahliae VdLs.17]KAF3350423.1 DNA repair protein rhp41 [Verticillium dahliae VDG2]KAH6702445.1 hypothetical protein EV126DRAFT_521793 [Verticillium dahliae]EGY18749.1 hypothetical protein VDAG_08909 [Verticillium dahliae VdLs.17]PNH36639.1 hypothetical protein BJF96_g230 [Verticillium dahliae]PNH39070.1 hypothetical protein VD0004_g7777 [Verticillium dahliae]
MPAVNGPATAWDDKAHADLLIEVLKVVKPTPAQWNEIVTGTQAKGYSYSSSAAQQHIAKLQKKEGNGAGTPAKSTPAKSTPGKKTPASGKRKASAKKAAAVSTDEVKDDDEEMETPSKKVKTKEEVDDVDIKQPSALDMEAGDVDNDYEV